MGLGGEVAVSSDDDAEVVAWGAVGRLHHPMGARASCRDMTVCDGDVVLD